MFATNDNSLLLAEPPVAAKAAGLRYVCADEIVGITRHRHGTGFRYRSPDGERLRDAATLERIRALAIPPAWVDVWISPLANAHLLATGRDVKGRKQYRYNPEFVGIRDAAKFGHLLSFGEVLPKIRERVAADLGRAGMPREKVLATIVALLEATLIRVGNEDYARTNGSYGLTTLRNRHVRVEGSELRFLFHGKSGKTWRLSLTDRRVAKVIRACQELPGQHLFQYRDEDGETRKISSGDVNDYLREIAERDVTAKDFRTWAGTVEAASCFHAILRSGEKPLKKHVRAVIDRVAGKLGNTPTICRKCYVHPAIPAAFLDGTFALRPRRTKVAESDHALDPLERAVMGFLKLA